MRIAIKDIKLSPYQVRDLEQDPDLAALAESIKEHGQLQPIKVRPIDEGYECIFGHRRLKAAELAGWTEVEAMVSEASDEEAAIQNLIENIMRKDLTIPEKGDGALALLVQYPDKYPSQHELAAALNVSPDAVITWVLAAGKLSPLAREQAQRHRIGYDEITKLYGRERDEQDEIVRALMEGEKLRDRQVRKFFELLDEGPNESAHQLIQRVRERKPDVRVNLDDLPSDARKQVEIVLEERSISARDRRVEAGRRSRGGKRDGAGRPPKSGKKSRSATDLDYRDATSTLAPRIADIVESKRQKASAKKEKAESQEKETKETAKPAIQPTDADKTEAKRQEAIRRGAPIETTSEEFIKKPEQVVKEKITEDARERRKARGPDHITMLDYIAKVDNAQSGITKLLTAAREVQVWQANGWPTVQRRFEAIVRLITEFLEEVAENEKL